jgi:hypothetical protein
MVHTVVSNGETRLFDGMGDGGVQLRMVAIAVGWETKLIDGESGSVPVLTDHRSTPQFGVGVGDGNGLGDGVTPQVTAGVDELRGFGDPAAKSELLLSLSVQPLLILETAFVLLGAFVAALPSKQLAEP